MTHSILTATRAALVLAAAFGMSHGAFAAPSLGPNLVQNGDFSQTTNGNGEIVPGQTSGTYITSANNWYSYNTSGNSGYPFLFITNNAVTTGFNDAWDNGVRYLYGNGGAGGAANSWNGAGPNPVVAGNPGNYLVADGDYHATAISQTINGLVTGMTYALSFSWAAAQFVGFSGSTTEDWAVLLGSNTANVQYTPTYNLASHGFSGWLNATMTFTYDGSSNILSFLAQGTPAGQPPMLLLDNVSLSAVPEPGSLALVGGVVVAGVLAVRRRRKARAAA